MSTPTWVSRSEFVANYNAPGPFREPIEGWAAGRGDTEWAWFRSRQDAHKFVEAESAIQCLREIAAMGKKAGSEAAKTWLFAHGYPLEPGGYVPGRGHVDELADG